MASAFQETNGAFPVLIVEDDRFMRTILAANLQEAGYRVVSAVNGSEALEIISRDHFPIVITDWVMPEMDGLELCRAIRSGTTDRYTYIILLTAHNDREDLIIGLEAGADEYLIKPVNQAELTVRLKTARRILDLESSLKKSLAEIKAISVRDPLTEAYNRRYLNELLPQEIKRAYRYKRPLSVIMFDIDHFKEVNDRYDHHAGDLVLQGCAGCIMGSLRKGIDWLARYGGEEFVIVLPETDLTGAGVVAERLRLKIAELITSSHGQEIRITASFGVVSISQFPQQEMIQALTMVEHADHCMYEAKCEGRNRIKAMQL